MTNDTHRRFPRTLQEAFGPYTSREVAEPAKPLTLFEIIAYPASVAIVAALLVACA